MLWFMKCHPQHIPNKQRLGDLFHSIMHQVNGVISRKLTRQNTSKIPHEMTGFWLLQISQKLKLSSPKSKHTPQTS